MVEAAAVAAAAAVLVVLLGSRLFPDNIDCKVSFSFSLTTVAPTTVAPTVAPTTVAPTTVAPIVSSVFFCSDVVGNADNSTDNNLETSFCNS